ncbi:hypothetical protein H0H93_009351 [Arthromyces matolae]|nr:hypothetical protein H0H93_009351 [Arthromyces matolae]
MSTSIKASRKGKEKVIGDFPEPLLGPVSDDASTSESSLESAESSLESDSDSDLDSDDSITPDYLESLLQKARQSYASASAKGKTVNSLTAEEEVITLDGDHEQKPLPQLDPGGLPAPYFELGETRFDGPSSMRDPDVESAERASSSRSVPAPPVAPPELTKSGKPLTRREKKELKNKTAGSDWFDLAAPAEADLPRMYREVEALRLRNQLDPKRFYRKDDGEGKGIKGLPKYFAIGTILPSSTPFGTASGENLSRANRKRTLVEELVDDAEAKRYAKKKFEELQSVRGSKDMTESDIKRIGVARGYLVFNQDRIAKMAKHTITHSRRTKAVVKNLYQRLDNILCAVDTGSSMGFKMLANEVLITLTTIPSTQHVVILPEREIEPEDVFVAHPVTGAHLSFGGTIDYVVLESGPKGWALGSRFPMKMYIDRSVWRRTMLVNLDDPLAPNYGMCGREIPLAVSKAIAFSVSLDHPQTPKSSFFSVPVVRFCTTDGSSWRFYILITEHGKLTYYESPLRALGMFNSSEVELQKLTETVLILTEWLTPTVPDLFTLEKGLS